MQTIGVLGGIGPQATSNFEQLVYAAAKRRTHPHADAGSPPMVVLYQRQSPILLHGDGSPRMPFEADPDLIRSARVLGRASDFLVILSNAAHVVQKDVELASGRNVLSMIDLTIAEVQKRAWKRVGLLAMGNPIAYSGRLTSLGVVHETVDAESRTAADAIGELRRRGIDGVILASTDLRENGGNADVIDPTRLLAEAAVERSMGGK